MNGRILAVICFFWAVLTIVAPTLILLSESSKPGMDNKDKFASSSSADSTIQVTETGEMKSRKMMEKVQRVGETAAAPVEAPEPSPEPEPVSGNWTADVILGRISENNQMQGMMK